MDALLISDGERLSMAALLHDRQRRAELVDTPSEGTTELLELQIRSDYSRREEERRLSSAIRIQSAFRARQGRAKAWVLLLRAPPAPRCDECRSRAADRVCDSCSAATTGPPRRPRLRSLLSVPLRVVDLHAPASDAGGTCIHLCPSCFGDHRHSRHHWHSWDARERDWEAFKDAGKVTYFNTVTLDTRYVKPTVLMFGKERSAEDAAEPPGESHHVVTTPSETGAEPPRALLGWEKEARAHRFAAVNKADENETDAKRRRERAHAAAKRGAAANSGAAPWVIVLPVDPLPSLPKESGGIETLVQEVAEKVEQRKAARAPPGDRARAGITQARARMAARAAASSQPESLASLAGLLAGKSGRRATDAAYLRALLHGGSS